MKLFTPEAWGDSESVVHEKFNFVNLVLLSSLTRLKLFVSLFGGGGNKGLLRLICGIRKKGEIIKSSFFSKPKKIFQRLKSNE